MARTTLDEYKTSD
jgi:hypothetical protein